MCSSDLALEARLGKTQEIVARCVKPSEGEPGLISSFIAMLPAHAGKMRPPAEEIIRDQILDLLAVSFANVVGIDRPRLSSSRSLALMRLRAAIETRLSNPSLDAAAAAAAAGVSIRYANAMLAVEGTSIMRLIQTRRLARCRTALADPMQMNRTLREIAFGWGFSDMTHFGRKFKATYGMLPSEYRRLVERP